MAKKKVTPAEKQIADFGKAKAKQLKAKEKFRLDQMKAFDKLRKQ